MDIREQIKKWMSKKNISYRELADRCGWSFQNIWIKLNNVSPNYETVVRILKGMGLSVRIERAENPDEMDPDQRAEKVAELTTEQKISFEAVEELIAALGYQVKIVDNGTTQNNE